MDFKGDRWLPGDNSPPPALQQALVEHLEELDQHLRISAIGAVWRDAEPDVATSPSRPVSGSEQSEDQRAKHERHRPSDMDGH
jgi:hypothetical protein